MDRSPTTQGPNSRRSRSKYQGTAKAGTPGEPRSGKLTATIAGLGTSRRSQSLPRRLPREKSSSRRTTPAMACQSRGTRGAAPPPSPDPPPPPSSRFRAEDEEEDEEGGGLERRKERGEDDRPLPTPPPLLLPPPTPHPTGGELPQLSQPVRSAAGHLLLRRPTVNSVHEGSPPAAVSTLRRRR